MDNAGMNEHPQNDPNVGSEPQLSKRSRRLIFIIIGTIVLGAIGSGVWDVLAKPGLSAASRFALNLVTLGSGTVKDAAYSSAALDPYPLPSLIVILILTWLPLWPFATALGFRMGRFVANRQQQDKRIHRRLESLITAAYVLVTIAVLAYAFVFTQIINQAILIRRVFYADLAICSPYISETDEKRLRAHFASVKTRADYDLIAIELKQIATTNKISLREESLW
jgi:hypothetical protein